MLLPVTEGGTSEYSSNGLILKEYPDKAPVLNGWIFSAFGLFDAWKLTGKQEYLSLLAASLMQKKQLFLIS